MDIQPFYHVLKPPVLLYFVTSLRKPVYIKKGLFCIVYLIKPVKLYVSTIQSTGNSAIFFSGPGFIFKGLVLAVI